MRSFKLIKHLSLDFIGEEWKDAYIDFRGLTVNDVKTKFPMMTQLSQGNQEEMAKGIDIVLGLLKDKFIGGKGVDEKTGQLIDLTVEDLEALPVEVLTKAIGFLSQSTTPNSKTP
jgi:hypothetical protein